MLKVEREVVTTKVVIDLQVHGKTWTVHGKTWTVDSGCKNIWHRGDLYLVEDTSWTLSSDKFKFQIKGESPEECLKTLHDIQGICNDY